MNLDSLLLCLYIILLVLLWNLWLLTYLLLFFPLLAFFKPRRSWV